MENLPEGVPWDPATNPPLGPLVDATPRPLPARIPHKGQSVDLEPLHIRHAEDLWRAAERDTSGEGWAYMGYGPFKDAAAMRAHVAGFAATHDPIAWAIRPHRTGTVDGWLTLMQIAPAHADIEIGNIWFSPRMQRTRAATEAMFLLMRHAMDDLGYRRLVWKCNALNMPSRRAAARLGFTLRHEGFFDTITLEVGGRADAVMAAALKQGFNLRRLDDGGVSIAMDETVSRDDLARLVAVLAEAAGKTAPSLDALTLAGHLPEALRRTSSFLTASVFNSHHSEHGMLRYMKSLEDKDVALNRSMIPLGSCTMKLNATAEMIPVTFPGFGNIHPFAPVDQAAGYITMIRRLEAWLARITGFAAVSLQPNAGSQGEYAGLLAIRAWHLSRGDADRTICLIPSSAHGTNPASAVMAGMQVVVVGCDRDGNVDIADLKAKLDQHGAKLAALMVTYPSTHGVFEAEIKEICALVHAKGGQVYMDGANMNAQVGLTSPGTIGADVCHLNLHKTFCIPHGGGGPGVGPIGVAAHLAPHLPNHPMLAEAGPATGFGPVSAAPFGSASILPISYAYIRMMGPEALRRATEVAILSANYMAKRLDGHFPVLYKGANGMVAHECILDCRGFQQGGGVLVEDIAKRLQDYGFHAPTMSWPVAGTLMVEPTESEPKAELDRFIDAMIAIRAEIRAVEQGRMDKADNPLKNAPHTAAEVMAEAWTHPYSREQAAFPLPFVKARKYWPPVKRVDNVYGDRNLVCTCAPLESYAQQIAAE